MTHHLDNTRITSSCADPVEAEAYCGKSGTTIIRAKFFFLISSSTVGIDGFLYRMARNTSCVAPNRFAKVL